MTARIIPGTKQSEPFGSPCRAVGGVPGQPDMVQDDLDALDALATLRERNPQAYRRVVDELLDAAAEERGAADPPRK